MTVTARALCFGIGSEAQCGSVARIYLDIIYVNIPC